MRELAIKEVSQISGGNILKEGSDIMSHGLSAEAQTIAVGALCSGLIVGGIMGRAAGLLGVAGFATWLVYDTAAPYVWDYFGYGDSLEPGD